MQPARALDLTLRLRRQLPDAQSLDALYSAHLQTCRRHLPTSYSLARSVHGHIITSGFKPPAFIITTLVGLYVKFNKLSYAQSLFDEMPQPDVVARTTMISAHCSRGHMRRAREVFDQTPIQIRNVVCYTALISGYARNGDGHGALTTFKDMVQRGLKPNDITLGSLLSGLKLIAESERECEEMHSLVLKSGTDCYASVLNALLALYCTCASSPIESSASLLNGARRLFDEISERDAYTWNTMIFTHSSRGHMREAREVFDQTPVQMRNVVCYTALIGGYARNGDGHGALTLFKDMVQRGFKPDDITLSSLLSGLRLIAESERECEEMHCLVLKCGTDCYISVLTALLALYCTCASSPIVSSASLLNAARKLLNGIPERDAYAWTAMITGYMNCGCISEAKELFGEMPEKDILTWTIMVSGLARNGCGEEALRLLNQMKMEGFEPGDCTFAGAINACSLLAALGHGRQLHAQVVRLGYESSLSAGTSLITMYSRCGVIQDARLLFLTMPFLNTISWNAIIAGVGQHGHGEEALDLFEMMLEEEILPDQSTYLSVIAACSNAGLVKEGEAYFNSMRTCYGITPGEGHYGRMIDLLCRAGKFSEAKKLLKSMPFEPSARVWRSFLPGCKIHGNLELGIEAAEHVIELIPEDDVAFVLLANMYADAGKWDQAAGVKKIMRDRGVKSVAGCSWIEVDSNAQLDWVDDFVHTASRG